MKYSISKRPNPMNKDETPKYYTTPVWDAQSLADEISLVTSLSLADARACLYSFLQAVPNHLMADRTDR